MSYYRGKRVLVTGGSSGIGLATALDLARKGAHVAICARDETRLKAAQTELIQVAESKDQKLLAVPFDVTVKASVDAGVERALRELGEVDLVINNAGFAIPGYIEKLTEKDYTTMLEVNYLGAVRVISALLPQFMARRSGAIANVTSMLGFMGTFGYAAYAGSKYALAGYTECLRQDLKPYGIQVHLCFPPTTKTPGLELENKTKPPEAWAIEGASRAFSPDDVARALLEGIRKKRFHILVGTDSSLIWTAQRLAPSLVRWMTDDILFKHLKKHGDGRKKAASESATEGRPSVTQERPSERGA